MIESHQAIRLFDECLADRISDEEGVLLLRYLEKHPEFTGDVYDSLYVDFLLQRRVRDGHCDDQGILPEILPGTLNRRFSQENFDQWIDELERLAETTPTYTVDRSRQHFTAKSGFFDRFRQLGRLYEKGKPFRKPLVTLACIAFLLVGVYGFYREFAASRAAIVAHITGFDEVVWETGEMPVEAGDSIKRKPLRIRSGSISLKTLNGADVVLEGPAELRIDSQSNWHLPYGYLSANVPPQNQKLRIRTGQMSIDVLGTEFWIKATGEKSEVHLLRGKLNLHGGSIHSQALNPGDAFSMSALGETKLFKALENQLLKADALVSRVEQKFRIRREKVLQAVNGEPSLLLYFDFQEFGRTLPNLAAHGRPFLDSARVEGCTQISGGVPGEKAVAFRNKSDRLLLELEKPLESFTLFARVRVDAEIKHRCALLISEKSAPGSIQWMIARNGIPVLNICRDTDSVFENFAAPKTFEGPNLRRWKALAVVYDVSGNKVDWYLDGALLGSCEMKEPVGVTLGRGMIGFGTDRNDTLLPGAGFGISELRLYERVLTAEEILQLNNP